MKKAAVPGWRLLADSVRTRRRQVADFRETAFPAKVSLRRPSWRPGLGHKLTFTARSKILSRSTCEWQVSDSETEPDFGSIRPVAAVHDWRLPGSRSENRARHDLRWQAPIIAAILEAPVIEASARTWDCRPGRCPGHWRAVQMQQDA